jgi:GTP-binding protein
VIRESQDDVSLRIEQENTKSEFVTMHGRGDLHLGVILEKMRREGFEMSVRPPQVITKESEDGRLLEPYEEVKIDCDLEYVSGIIDKMNERKGILMDIQDQKDGR